jgi:hypothetical protein
VLVKDHAVAVIGPHVRLAPLPLHPAAPESSRQVVSVTAIAVVDAATPMIPNTAALITLFLMDRTLFSRSPRGARSSAFKLLVG